MDMETLSSPGFLQHRQWEAGLEPDFQPFPLVPVPVSL